MISFFSTKKKVLQDISIKNSYLHQPKQFLFLTSQKGIDGSNVGSTRQIFSLDASGGASFRRQCEGSSFNDLGDSSLRMIKWDPLKIMRSSRSDVFALYMFSVYVVCVNIYIYVMYYADFLVYTSL